MIVDSHAHLVPPALLADIRDQASVFPSLRLVGQGEEFGFSFAGSKPTRPVAKPLRDLPRRLTWMSENGIDRQVVGGWVDMFGYELPAGEGVAWSQLINQHLLAASKVDPRFVPLATVPLQNGLAAAAMLKQVCETGFPGVMIGTQPKGAGSTLDDPALIPFWEAAHEQRAVVFIHPVFESGDSRVHDYGMANAVGRVTDTMIAVGRLLFAGYPLRYSGAKIICGIGGSALPAILGRLRTNAALDRALADPEANLRAMTFDTILQDPRALRFVADTVGVDRLMLGSDYPFPIGDRQPRRIVQEAGFSADEQGSIETLTAQALFGL